METKHPRILKKCEFCQEVFDRPIRVNTPFRVSWYAYAKLRFCSPTCRSKWFGLQHLNENNPNWRGGKPKCIDCGINLSQRGKDRNRCKPCWYKFHRGQNHSQWSGKTICPDCGKRKVWSAQTCSRCASKRGAFRIHRPSMIKENVSYHALHRWVVRWLGSPVSCSHCGEIGKKDGKRWSIDWANKSGKYLRNLEDWISLCRKCHRAYDKR